jgi:hypothetical protein
MPSKPLFVDHVKSPWSGDPAIAAMGERTDWLLIASYVWFAFLGVAILVIFLVRLAERCRRNSLP